MHQLTVHTGRIDTNPANPREDLGDLTELAASIRAVGLLEPIVVEPTGRGRYRLLAGERRFAASKIARIDVLPAYCRGGIDPLIAALVENGHRKPLTPVEQARAMGQLQQQGYSQAHIARLTGYSSGYVSTRLALLELDDATLTRIQVGTITADDALAAVRKTRGRSGPRQSRPRHFSGQHPLADTARQTCETGGHIRRDGSSVACGRCWEAAIRNDERAQLGAEPSEPVDDIDEIAVRRSVAGDTAVDLTDAEYEEAFRQTVEQHGWNKAMTQFTISGSVARRVNRGRRTA